MNSTSVKLLVIAGLLILWSGCQKETAPKAIEYNYKTGPAAVLGCDPRTYQDKVFYYPVGTGISVDKTCIKDFRYDQVYPIVKIGNQVWMAENLRHNTLESISSL